MEYLITADRPFEEIEARTIDALERGGFVVRRTFSLHSATAAAEGGTDGDPGYSVLMLYASGARQQPLGLVTVYERGDRIAVQPVLTSPGPGSQDVHAELVAALALGGLHLCVEA
jgi:hypothetical protein